MNLLTRWINSPDARTVAYGCLLDIIIKGQSLAEIQPQINNHSNNALIREMVFGVCRWFYLLEKQSKDLLQKPLRKKDTDVSIIIYLGMYQLRFMSTQSHAAVHETVNLIKKIKKPWAKALINAILRKYSKLEHAELTAEDHQNSFPDWLKLQITNDWESLADSCFIYSNLKAPLSIRVNRKLCSIDEYTHKLTSLGFEYELDPSQKYCINFAQSFNIAKLPGFETGEFYVQDGSAQFAAELLNVADGHNILDACAAPGGKTSHIAELANNLIITALEREPSRIERMQQNLKRLGHKATIICGDASDTKPWFKGILYDRILIDAPCSATGIIRRHPDIKSLRKSTDIEALNKIQFSILNALWPLLKKGGELLYCTCSILKSENENQIARFLKHSKDCEEIKIEVIPWGHVGSFGIQVLPNTHNKDGFYYAKLRKL